MLSRWTLSTAFLFLSLSACGGGGSSADAGAEAPPTTCTPTAALQTVASAAGSFNVSACAMDTPARGENAFTFLITDAATGAAVDGLTVAVQPWMPDMGHGSPATPTVTAPATGLYDVTNCVFTMGGVWQLRTTLSGGSLDSASDSAVVQFTID